MQTDMNRQAGLRVAYLVNQYPKVSHSFIRREILALERQGVWSNASPSAAGATNSPMPPTAPSASAPATCCSTASAACSARR